MTVDRSHAVDAVDVARLLEAARAAPGPVGPVRWFARPVADGVELRSTVRAWAGATGRAAVGMRMACGAALCNVRVAMLAGGRVPMIGFPLRSGHLVTIRAGAAAEPRPADLAMVGQIDHIRPGSPAADVTVVRGVLRRLADVHQVWLRLLSPAQGERLRSASGALAWPSGVAGDRPDAVVALLGAPATDRIGDLRLGRAAQHLRLLSADRFGWDLAVRAGPVAVPVDGHPGYGIGPLPPSVLLVRAVPGTVAVSHGPPVVIAPYPARRGATRRGARPTT